MLALGAISMVGIGIFGYGLVTLIDLVASPRGGESMTSTTMSGVAFVALFVGGVIAAVAGGIAWSMRRRGNRLISDDSCPSSAAVHFQQLRLGRGVEGAGQRQVVVGLELLDREVDVVVLRRIRGVEQISEIGEPRIAA